MLAMRYSGLTELPPLELPDGHALRHFQDGDDVHWERVVAAAFDSEDRPDRFDTRMRRHPAFRPERVLFITHNGLPVATASAWEDEINGRRVATVHMLGVLPSFRGKRLGYWLNLAVLHRHAEEGRHDVYLVTDDDRLPAIKTYLRLGFEPLIVHPNQPARWASVFKALGTRK